ncbi:MAG TPA: AAA family ATPase [Candidatus Limnocylindrales bacterium]|nr:AAA family ATPase [Candidatus Limnocylindrales bacterium]
MGHHALIGRSDELDLARGLLERARDGSPGVLLIGGEAGVGRSRLVTAVADEAEAMGFRCAIGACLRMDAGALTYAAVVDGLRRLVGRLDPAEAASTMGAYRHEMARLLPDIPHGPGSGVDPPAGDAMARLRLFEALTGWLNRLSERGPLLLVVEDLHWADAATLDLVRASAVGLVGRTALVITTRTDELLPPAVSSTLAELVRDGAERVELQPFDRASLAELVAMMRPAGGADVPAIDVERLHERTGGNPFLAIELIEAGFVEPDTAGMVPQTLHDILGARLAALDPAVLDLLRAASLHPGALDDGVLANVLDAPVRTVGAALREARDAGVLTGEGVYRFRHALQAEVLAAQLGPSERRLLHAAFAAALEVTGDPATATSVAWHRDAAGEVRAALAAHLEALACASRASAFDAAWRHAARAAELRSLPEPAGDGPAVSTLLAQASRAALLAGDPEAAVDFARAALAAIPGGDDAGPGADALRAQLHWALWEAGDRATAALEIERACAAMSPATPPAVRALMTAQRAATHMEEADAGTALAMAEEARGIAMDAGAREAEALALGVRGRVLAGHGSVDDGVASLRQAVAIAEDIGNLQGWAVGVATVATVLTRWGRAREALTDIDEAIATADACGLARSLGAQLIAQGARACHAIGAWDEAARRTADGLTRRPAEPVEVQLRAVALRLAAGRGQPVEAVALEQRLRAIAGSAGDPEDAASVRVARAEAALAAGDPGAVRPLFDEQLEVLRAGLEPGPSAAWLAVLAAGAEADLLLDARARGQEADVATAGTRLETIASIVGEEAARAGTRWGALAEPIVAQVEAEAARVQPDTSRRVAAWERTVRAWEAVNRPAYAASARRRLAEAHLAHGASRAVVARELSAAAETAGRIGAAPLLAQLDRLARLARLDHRTWRSPAADAGRVDAVADAPADPLATLGLTPREREILRLVAAGWSNGKIADHLVISVSTASVHVSNILAKLDVENRVEAAALAHRLGVIGESPAASPADA